MMQQSFSGFSFCSSCKVIHAVVYTYDFSKEPVKYFDREYCLPEANEVQTERYSTEDSVPFDGSDDSAGDIFRF